MKTPPQDRSRHIEKLLPPGLAWQTRDNPLLQAWLNAAGGELDAVEKTINKLRNELNLDQTEELLPEWEKTAALTSSMRPVERRRAAIRKQLISSENVSKWHILDSFPQSALLRETGPNKVEIIEKNLEAELFQAGISQCGNHMLDTREASELEQEMRRTLPAHIRAEYRQLPASASRKYDVIPFSRLVSFGGGSRSVKPFFQNVDYHQPGNMGMLFRDNPLYSGKPLTEEHVSSDDEPAGPSWNIGKSNSYAWFILELPHEGIISEFFITTYKSKNARVNIVEVSTADGPYDHPGQTVWKILTPQKILSSPYQSTEKLESFRFTSQDSEPVCRRVIISMWNTNYTKPRPVRQIRFHRISLFFGH